MTAITSSTSLLEILQVSDTQQERHLPLAHLDPVGPAQPRDEPIACQLASLLLELDYLQCCFGIWMMLEIKDVALLRDLLHQAEPFQVPIHICWLMRQLVPQRSHDCHPFLLIRPSAGQKYFLVFRDLFELI